MKNVPVAEFELVIMRCRESLKTVRNLTVKKLLEDFDAKEMYLDPKNRPFSYSEKESQSNDTLLHFVEFSNVHNTDRSSNATRSNLVYENV